VKLQICKLRDDGHKNDPKQYRTDYFAWRWSLDAVVSSFSASYQSRSPPPIGQPRRCHFWKASAAIASRDKVPGRVTAAVDAGKRVPRGADLVAI
jgi:hypothetical protein